MTDRSQNVADYKKILRTVINERPSGMAQRLSVALGKNRSFISQISNPAYKIPIPYKHLDTIFKVCGFSTEQRKEFLDAYSLAHPKYAAYINQETHTNIEKNTIILPSTGNKEVDDEIKSAVLKLANDMVNIYKNT